jgi:hypothetical protein
MKKERHIDFLNHFLKCLGFNKYIITMIRKNKLYGKVFYDEFEYEKIRLDLNDLNLIDDNVIKITELLAELNLVEIDKIKISRTELYTQFINRFGNILTQSDFDENVKCLENIKIDRLDRNKVFDWFFIHE